MRTTISSEIAINNCYALYLYNADGILMHMIVNVSRVCITLL